MTIDSPNHQRCGGRVLKSILLLRLLTQCNHLRQSSGKGDIINNRYAMPALQAHGLSSRHAHEFFILQAIQTQPLNTRKRDSLVPVNDVWRNLWNDQIQYHPAASDQCYGSSKGPQIDADSVEIPVCDVRIHNCMEVRYQFPDPPSRQLPIVVDHHCNQDEHE